MADTTIPTALTPEQWDSRFFTQYLQNSRFKDLMGTDENSVIQMKEDLTKKRGDRITIALVNRLTNDPVTGTSVLEGNEEDMASRSHSITIEKRRNGVRIAEQTEQFSAIDLREAGRAVLMDWAMEDTRDLIITQLGSLNGTAFTSRTATIADAWLVDNKDRTVFGAYAAGGSAGGTDLSADLGQLDTTSDLFNVTALDSMILQAKLANPKVRPVRDLKDGKRYYVAFAHPAAFKNLRDSIDTEVLASTVVQAQAAKLFEGGDIFWNGCIVKELDDLPVYANIGNGSTVEVTPVYLMGAQAVGYALAKRWKSVTEQFDYGDKHGIAIESIYGVSKLRFGTGATDTDDQKDHGVVTGFFATTHTSGAISAGEVA
jgi:N4-gp56 family major capsid protein